MKKFIRLFSILGFIILITFCYSFSVKTPLAEDKDNKNPSSVAKTDTLIWHKYDKGLAKAQKEKKHVIIAFYTNWCGWCRRMDKSTYTDAEIKKVLNQSYVAIKVNGESKDEVEVEGKKITERELTKKFSVRSYPTTWFLKQSGDKIAPYYGYTDAGNFVKVLNFIKDDLYDKMSFEEYLKNQENEKDGEKK